jgi:hypothetical protein
MKVAFTVLWSIVLVVSTSSASLAQGTECGNECVRTVRVILNESYQGYSSGFVEKANNRLGDKVGVALLKIYPGKAMYEPDNIRTFLPVIDAAFKYPDMIRDPQDRHANVTLPLLHRLQNKIKDHFLHQEITKTVNAVEYYTRTTKPE